MTLINSTANQAYQRSKTTKDYNEFLRGFAEVKKASSEQAMENFGGPDRDDQWHATNLILKASEGMDYVPSSQARVWSGLSDMLSRLPEKPNAANIAGLIHDVHPEAPADGPERKGYLAALCVGGAGLAAQFATDETLKALLNLRT